MGETAECEPVQQPTGHCSMLSSLLAVQDNPLAEQAFLSR
jgi:hypothetical protein